MKKYLLIAAVILSCGQFSYAQKPAQAKNVKTVFTADGGTTKEKCAAGIIHNKLMQTDAAYRSRILANEQAIQSIIQNQAGSRGSSRGTIYSIPVVVHVIHTGQAEGTGANISDAQIQSAITALNEDFRKKVGTNGDGAGVDCEIEFCLAVRDPNGLPTDGIMRVNGSGVTDYSLEGIDAGGTVGADEVAVKALSKWPNTDYYNIWIVTEIENNGGGSGIQGYAYFPGASSSVDGTVILYNAFGTTGNLKTYTDMNRVATHELGHGLNLYHTFEGESCTQTNCSTQGDRVCDTPPTRSGSTCATGSCANTQKENYMDYTEETCQNMFTLDQSTRMRAAIEGTRSSLLSSMGCVPVNNYDAGIIDIIKPTGTTCLASQKPEVVLKNFGSVTLTSVTISYNLDGGANSTFSWTGSLAANATANVLLLDITYTTGTHTFNAFTSNPNGVADENTANDASSETFTATTAVTGQALPLSEGFQNTTFPPSGWAVGNPNADVTWARSTAAGGFGNSTASAMMNNYNTDTRNTVDSLYTPYLDFSGVAAPAELTFSVAYARYDATFHDSLIIVASYDCGATWNRIYAKGSADLPTAPDNTAAFTPSSTQWRAEALNMDAYIGYSGVRVAFINKGGYGNRLFVDDVLIKGASVLPVADFSGTPTAGCGSLTVNFTDLSTGSPTSWAWDFDNNGSTDATTQNPSYTYSAAGTYTVKLTATNSSGSDDEIKTGYIVVNPAPSVTISSTNVKCNGGADGSATANPTGGTSPYTYSWSNTATTQNISGLTAGAYTVTVTDSKGCTKSASVTITQPTALAVTASKTDVKCNGGSDGTASSSPSGGVSPYTYLWSNTATTQNISGLIAGIYTVTVTDANNCTKTASVTVSEPATIILSTSKTDVTCNGGTNGSATASATGGTGTYTYTWSNTATSATISGLTAGTYTVTVKDGNNCTKSASVTISQPTAIAPSITKTDVKCNGGADGSATASATGGTGTYTYSWSNAATTATISGLTAGTYTVTVKDGNNCTKSASVIINQPTAIAPSITKTDVKCNAGADGSATASATGGTGTYTYSWSNTATTATISGLTAGTYTVTVTDGNNCTKSASVAINQPAAISPSITKTDVKCNGDADGSATASATGGTGTYTYSWSNAATTATITGLTAGTYTVTVKDGNNCTKSASVTISQPTAIAPSITKTDVKCNGGADGSATASATGGTGTYTYTWSNAATTATISGLTAGTYTVTVKDGNNCTKSASVTITAPAAISLSATTTDATCGNADGAISASATGGTGTITYSIDGTNFQATGNFTGLLAGTYTVTAKDGNACTKTTSVTINNVTSLTLSTSQTNVTCNGGSDGSITATGGGSSGYTYSIDDVTYQASGTFSGLAAGTYIIYVKDANNCKVSKSVTITQPSAISPSISKTDIKCFGGNDGSATASATGGTGTYTYTWSNTATTATISGLTAGTYTVTVTDGNNCTKSASVVITQPTAISPSITKTDVTCNGGTDGSATASATGGTGTYTYSWSNAATTATVTGLAVGTYTVTITDANNCTGSASVTVAEPSAISLSATTTDATCGNADGAISASASGGTGAITYSLNGTNFQSTGNFTGLNAGTYTVTAKDGNGCITSITANINNSGGPTALSISITDATCGASDGQVDIIGVTGGTSPYTYSIDGTNFSTTTVYSGLAAGSYSVSVKDANGCQFSTTVTVNDIGGDLTASVTSQTNVSTNGGSDGSITVDGAGGTTPYTYSIDGTNFQSTGTFSGLTAGTYTITVKDANGCTAAVTSTITEPSAGGTVTFGTPTVTNASCNGCCDGAITTSVSGGTAPYTYTWSPDISSGASADSLCAGTYVVCVTDANNNQVCDTIVITQPGVLTVGTPAVTNATCNGCCDGAIGISPAGGTAPYTITITSSTGAVTSSPADSLCAGDYIVCVTDSSGNTVCDTVTVSQPTGIKEASAENSLNIYPNPGRNYIVLDIHLSKADRANISFTNLLGQQLFAEEAALTTSMKLRYDIEKLPVGVYFVTVQTGEGKLVQRFVKN